MNNALHKIYNLFESFIIRNRRLIVIFIHFIHIALAYYLAFTIRFEFTIPPEYLKMMFAYLPLLLLIRMALFLRAGIYKDMWGYYSVSDMIRIINSITLGSVIFFVAVRYLFDNLDFPKSIYILEWLLLIMIAGGSRLSIRLFREYFHAHRSTKRILLVGAGDAGEIITRDLISNPKSIYEPIGFIDETPHNKGLKIRGIPILGPVSLIPEIIEKHRPDELLILTSSIENSKIKDIYEFCKPYNIPIKKLPELDDILSGNTSVATKLGHQLVNANLVTEDKVQEALSLQKKEGGRLGTKLVKLGYISEDKLISFLNRHFGISHMKPISLEDLLQREPIKAEIKSVRDFIENKVVIVTGAGGSIGSELCRQIIKYSPSELILFERYENNLFSIDAELKDSENVISIDKSRLRTIIMPVVGDVGDMARLEHVFSRYKPQIVFHAAAHKHVPLMEYNPIEAIKNNIFGTKNLIDVSVKHSAERFVMISTDKAVNPTSMMGATKRIAEFLTSSNNGSSFTKFTTVRFGNVLGSNGSVIHTFKEQLKHGGPIFVTHPEIKRFFMITSEAVQLVLLAAASQNGGKIYVLDMGEPIRIVDLAENLIRLSGFVPNDEIKISFTGLRPGEKLYEELFDNSEKIIPSFHDKIKVAVAETPSKEELDSCIRDLEQIIQNNSVSEIVYAIKKIVPNFNHRQILEVVQKANNF